MRVVVKEVGKLGEVREIKNDLEEYQNIVGGFIDRFQLTDDIFIILNDEGKLMGLEPNIGVPCNNGYVETIVGNIIFVGVDDCDFTGLKDEHIDFLTTLGILPKKNMSMDFYTIGDKLNDKKKVAVDTGRCLN